VPQASNILFQDYQFKTQTLRGFWKWTTRVDVSGSIPAYFIRDIMSPFGLLRDGVPLPGDVVRAMADSITELMSAFSPTILIDPVALTFTVDEGRGFSEAQTVGVTNAGVYGSILGAKLTTSAPFIRVTPTEVGGLAANEGGTFQVSVDSSSMVATMSPYAETIILQDTAATNSPRSLPVTVIVRPKASIVLPVASLSFTVSKPLSGPFPPIPAQTFQIFNDGDPASLLDYTIQRVTAASMGWLVSYSPPTGQIAGGASQIVSVVVQPDECYNPGTYTETLRVSGYSSNYYADVAITLTIL
jgi:hypothetical protein